MQLTPREGAAAEATNTPQTGATRRWARQNRVWTICFAIFCVEIGAFLTVFPWLESWRLNHFPTMFPWALGLWEDPYLRGAVSGLGLVNLIIAAAQVNHLLRSDH
jgi:hypothetical protein